MWNKLKNKVFIHVYSGVRSTLILIVLKCFLHFSSSVQCLIYPLVKIFRPWLTIITFNLRIGGKCPIGCLTTLLMNCVLSAKDVILPLVINTVYGPFTYEVLNHMSMGIGTVRNKPLCALICTVWYPGKLIHVYLFLHVALQEKPFLSFTYSFLHLNYINIDYM